MDGFCVNSKDLAKASAEKPITLPAVKGVDAGTTIDSLPPETCAYIATGGVLPENADAVVQIEHTTAGTDDSQVTFTRPVTSGNFVRKKAAEYSAGQSLVKPREKITPHLVGIFASAGLTSVKVYRKPVVGLLTSGDELVMPYEQPKPWQIRNANTSMLFAQIIEAGAQPVNFGIARDNPEQALKLIKRALEQVDILVTSGGISMGRKDPFKFAFAELGIQPDVYGVKIKPGKPLFFGNYQGTPIFGLPGNQVSTSVTFELFVRPFLRRISGYTNSQRLELSLPITQDSVNKTGRTFFKRARIKLENGKMMAAPLSSQESHMLSSIAGAQLLFIHSYDQELIAKGANVNCYLISNE
jgi:molybdopterin molybdotransferase